MASYTIEQYVATMYPNLSTLLPGFSTAIAINGAMALYWSYIFPEPIPAPKLLNPVVAPVIPDPGNPNDPGYLNEASLTERQKYMVALRVAISIMPIVNGWLTSPQIMEAQAGPAMTKFQDLSKLLRVVMPLWQTDLNNAEAAEGIFFNILPSIPAYLLKLVENYPILGETRADIGTPVIQSETFFIGTRNYPLIEGATSPNRDQGDW
jgi:hypothetical protein